MAFPADLVYLPLLLLLLLLLPLFSLFLVYGRRKEGENPSPKLPPGPTKLPIIGNLHLVGNLPHRSLWQLSQKHGTLMYLQLGRFPTIVVSSADTAKQVLKTYDLECCSRPSNVSATKLSYGCSDLIFSPYGEQWRHLRKLSTLLFFTTKKVQSFRCIREEEIARMIGSIYSQALPDSALVNLSEILFSLSNNIICRTGLGSIYHGSRFSEILKEFQALSTSFFFSDYLPMLGWVDTLTGMRARLDKNFCELDGFYQQVIDEHVDPMRPKQDLDAVDSLLGSQNEASQLTDSQVKGVLTDIFVAGTDTSASAIEWAMADLMRNPRVMRKAQDEVRSLIGRKGKVEEGDLHQLQYLESVVKEAMRLHPPVPLLQRETMGYCRIDGYEVPPKTRVLINTWAIGRDAGCWENPEEFYPERFLDSPVDLKGHDFQFIPFGSGRRICPAMESGLLVVKLGLANLLYSFDWKLPNGMAKEDIDMDEAPGMTVHRNSALYLVCDRSSGMET